MEQTNVDQFENAVRRARSWTQWQNPVKYIISDSSGAVSVYRWYRRREEDRQMIHRYAIALDMDTITIAAALEEIEIPANDVVAIFSPEDIELNDETKSLFADIENDPTTTCLYDLRGENNRIREKKTANISQWVNKGNVEIFYDGVLNDKLANAYVRYKFLEATKNVWCNMFIVGRTNARHSGKISSVKRAENLARALLGGRWDFHIPACRSKTKVEKWQKNLIATPKLCLSASNLPDKFASLMKDVKKFEDVAALWGRASEEHLFAITLDDSDLSDADFLTQKLALLGEVVGVESFLKAYEKGVPARDIIA